MYVIHFYFRILGPSLGSYSSVPQTYDKKSFTEVTPLSIRSADEVECGRSLIDKRNPAANSSDEEEDEPDVSSRDVVTVV